MNCDEFNELSDHLCDLEYIIESEKILTRDEIWKEKNGLIEQNKYLPDEFHMDNYISDYYFYLTKTINDYESSRYMI
jgi:hypothetical protein